MMQEINQEFINRYEGTVTDNICRAYNVNPEDRRARAVLAYNLLNNKTQSNDSLNTVLVYSDLLLDDLCALQALGSVKTMQHKEVIVIAENESELYNNDYGSDKVQSVEQAADYVTKWFSNVHVCTALNMNDVHGTIESIISLAPCTKLSKDIKTYNLYNVDTYIMGGSSQNPNDRAGEEYNACRDKEAYLFVMDKPNIKWYSFETCVDLYNKHSYKEVTNLEFIDEYKDKMLKLNDSLCCPDLQVILDMFY